METTKFTRVRTEISNVIKIVTARLKDAPGSLRIVVKVFITSEIIPETSDNVDVTRSVAPDTTLAA